MSKSKKKQQPKPVRPENQIAKWLAANPKVTFTQFGEMVGVQFQTVSTWVNEHRTDLSASTLVKIHEITEIPYDTLIAWASFDQLVKEGWFEKHPQSN